MDLIGCRIPENQALRSASGAQVIVTANLRDFPAAKLAPYAIEAQHPDEFVLHQIDLAAGLVCTAVGEQASSLKNPPHTVGDVLDTLRDNGLVQTVARLRELFGA